MRLHLSEAITRGETITDKGNICWNTWVSAKNNLVVIETRISGEEELSLKIKYNSAGDYSLEDVKESTRCKAHDGEILYRMSQMFNDRNYPSCDKGVTDGISWWKQQIPENGSVAAGYREIEIEKGHKYYICSINCDRKEMDCLSDILQTLGNITVEGIGKLWKEHIEWWLNYYMSSFLSIPDTKLEALYYIEVYKFACGVRPHGVFTTLSGPWTDDDDLPSYCDNDYHWNLEEQMQVSPIYSANRLEFGTALYDLIDHMRPNMRRFCKEFFGCEGEFIGHGTDLDGNPIPCLDNFEFNGLPWVCFYYWKHYLYSQDKQFLLDKAYPLMREAVRPLMKELRMEEDGYLHLPWSSSPEYHSEQETYRWMKYCDPDWSKRYGPDSTIDLSLLKFLLQTLLKVVEILKIEDPEQKDWEYSLEHLVPYYKDRWGGFAVRRDVSLTTSHRHASHLFPIYPLREVTYETDPETVSQCLKVIGVNGRGEWTGWSFPWIALIGAYSNRTSMARNILLDYADRYITESTVMYQGPQKSCDISLYQGTFGNFANTIEAGIGVMQAIQELILQSQNGIVRVFCNTPPAWANLAIESMRTEGAFLISASRKLYKTEFVCVTAECGGTFKLWTDFGTDSVTVEKNGVNNEYPLMDGLLTIETEPGDKLIIWSGEEKPSCVVQALEGNPMEYHYYGVKKISRF